VPVDKIWMLFDFSLVDWTALPRLVVQWLGLCFVVAFSSTLDVAAIEMELGSPLDYDRELTMVNSISSFTA
jgi:sulfate permease, SulP family